MAQKMMNVAIPILVSSRLQCSKGDAPWSALSIKKAKTVRVAAKAVLIHASSVRSFANSVLNLLKRSKWLTTSTVADASFAASWRFSRDEYAECKRLRLLLRTFSKTAELHFLSGVSKFRCVEVNGGSKLLWLVGNRGSQNAADLERFSVAGANGCCSRGGVCTITLGVCTITIGGDASGGSPSTAFAADS